MKRLLFWLPWILLLAVLIFVGTSTKPVSTAVDTPKEPATPVTQILSAEQLQRYAVGTLSFLYPAVLGDLTIASARGEQHQFASSNHNVGLVAYHERSKNVVFSIIDEGFDSLYLYNQSGTLRRMKSYSYTAVTDEAVGYQNVGYADPSFSVSGNYIMINYIGWEWSVPVLFDLVEKAEFWRPEIELGNFWSGMHQIADGQYDYSGVYWSDNEKYVVLTSAINRLSTEGDSVILALDLTTPDTETKAPLQIMRTADPYYLAQRCYVNPNLPACARQNEIDLDGPYFADVTVSDVGLVHFHYTNVLSNNPERWYYYNIPDFDLYPDPAPR